MTGPNTGDTPPREGAKTAVPGQMYPPDAPSAPAGAGAAATKATPPAAGVEMQPAEGIGTHNAKHFGEEPETEVTGGKAAGPQLEPAPSTKVKKNSRHRVSDEKIDKMSPAELRAVASDRGYQVPFGGRRGVAEAFKKAQADDDSLENPPKEGEEPPKEEEEE